MTAGWEALEAMAEETARAAGKPCSSRRSRCCSCNQRQRSSLHRLRHYHKGSILSERTTAAPLPTSSKRMTLCSTCQQCSHFHCYPRPDRIDGRYYQRSTARRLTCYCMRSSSDLLCIQTHRRYSNPAGPTHRTWATPPAELLAAEETVASVGVVRETGAADWMTRLKR